MVTINQVRSIFSANLTSAITWVPFLSVPCVYGCSAAGDTRAFVCCFLLPLLLEARELQSHFSRSGNMSELGNISRAPSAERCDIPEQAQAGQSLLCSGGKHRATVLPHLTSCCTIRPCTVSVSRAWRPSVKKASCKFSCKQGGKGGGLGLNFSLLCLRDLTGIKDFQVLFWWSLGEIKCIVCRRISLHLAYIKIQFFPWRHYSNTSTWCQFISTILILPY